MAQVDLQRMLTEGLMQPTQQPIPSSYREGMLQQGAQYAQGLRRGIGAVTGTDTRTQPEIVQQQLKDLGPIDTSNKEQRAKLLSIVNSVDPVRAIALKNQFDERDKQEQLQQEQKLLDEKTRTDIEAESARRWEEEQKLREQRVDFERQRLEQEEGVRKMLDKDIQRISGYERQADLSSGKARTALALADRYASLKPTGGVLGNAFSSLKSIVGGQDEVSSLKTELERLVNTGIINSLPPGVASDRDIALIKKGFPDSSWNPQEIERFLKAVAKISAYDAEKNMFKAEYSENNGGLETGMTRAWRQKINQPGYKEYVAEEYGLEYDIPQTDLIFDADRAAAAAAAAAEQREREQRMTQTPSSSAQSVAEAFK